MTLPDWFQALNTDFEYHADAVSAHSRQALRRAGGPEQRFGIAGGRPGLKVSWQITGVRQDAFALPHPFRWSRTSRTRSSGAYQHPQAWGQPEDIGVGYAQRQKGRGFKH